MSLRIAVLYGSVRQQRKGIRLARAVINQLRERGHEPTLVDAMERQLPLLDRMYKEYEKGKAPAALEEIAAILRGADAFIFVSGEYNHGLQPALKNLIDHFMNEFFWRPAGIVSYSGGAFGGARAAVHLRAVLGEVGLISIPTMLPVPRIAKSFEEDGTSLDDAFPRRIGRFLDELEWYARALAEARGKGVPYE